MDTETINTIRNFVANNPKLKFGIPFLKEYDKFSKARIKKRMRSKIIKGKDDFNPEGYYKEHLGKIGFDIDFLSNLKYVGKSIEDWYCCFGFKFSVKHFGETYKICVSIEIPYIKHESITEKTLFPFERRDLEDDIYVVYWIFDENKKHYEYEDNYFEIGEEVQQLLTNATKNVPDIKLRDSDTFENNYNHKIIEFIHNGEIISIPKGNIYKYDASYRAIFSFYKIERKVRK